MTLGGSRAQETHRPDSDWDTAVYYRGEWVTNEKTLLDRAGLREVDRIVAAMTPERAVLERAIADVRALGRERLNRR